MGIIENLENIEDRLATINKVYSTQSHLDEKSLQFYLSELDTVISELKSANSKFLNKELIKSLLAQAKRLSENIEDELKLLHSND